MATETITIMNVPVDAHVQVLHMYVRYMCDTWTTCYNLLSNKTYLYHNQTYASSIILITVRYWNIMTYFEGTATPTRSKASWDTERNQFSSSSWQAITQHDMRSNPQSAAWYVCNHHTHRHADSKCYSFFNSLRPSFINSLYASVN